MRRKIALPIAVLVFLVVIIAGYRPILIALGHFLIVEDRLEPSDVIVVLAGDRHGERMRQAAELYFRGVAPRIVLSGGDEWMGILDSELLRRQALGHHIPAAALLREDKSTSTAEQAQNLRPMLEQMGVRRATVVTSSFHSRRTRYVFRKVFSRSTVEIRVYPVQRDTFSPIEWWKREEDTEDLVLEYIKLARALLP